MIGITNAGGNIDTFGIRLLNYYPENPKNGDIVIYGIGNANGEITPWDIGEDRVDQAEDGYTFIHIDTAPQQFPVAWWANLHKRNPFLGLSCYWGPVLQKINGKYKQIIATLYFDGVWHQISAEVSQWDGTLWGPNNQHTDHTGGWGYASSNENAPSLGDNIRWSCENTTIFLYTNGAVNVTKFSRLRYDGQMWGETSFGLSNKNGWLDGNNWVARVTGNGTVYNGSVDISGISGSFYITAYASSEGDSGAQFNRIWLE